MLFAYGTMPTPRSRLILELSIWLNGWEKVLVLQFFIMPGMGRAAGLLWAPAELSSFVTVDTDDSCPVVLAAGTS